MAETVVTCCFSFWTNFENYGAPFHKTRHTHNKKTNKKYRLTKNEKTDWATWLQWIRIVTSDRTMIFYDILCTSLEGFYDRWLWWGLAQLFSDSYFDLRTIHLPNLDMCLSPCGNLLWIIMGNQWIIVDNHHICWLIFSLRMVPSILKWEVSCWVYCVNGLCYPWPNCSPGRSRMVMAWPPGGS